MSDLISFRPFSSYLSQGKESEEEPSLSLEPQNHGSFKIGSEGSKAVFIAISALMALGLILSFYLGAPWWVTFGFFVLSLAPLFSVWKASNYQLFEATKYINKLD